MLILTHSFSSSSTSLCRDKHRVQTLNSHRAAHLRRPTSLHFFNPLRSFVGSRGNLGMKQKWTQGFGPVCYSPPVTITTTNLQWICTISSAVLMFAKGTAIQKSFLVPLFALQAPATLASWIKGEYGIWTAFLALLVRLFFYIPGELELPFIALLMIIVSPYQVLNLRGRQEGVVLSLVIAAFLAFQHFTRVGNLRRAFDQGSFIATLAILFTVAVPCLLLI
ncbi:cold-regulated 413 inner membrane protein 2, chloroplastic-like [Cynara cardunculus var. scolymus]|uniref:Cold acclimation protein WCOR413 n=1 Tax=Cynara cardunculus var. scolymus TaxID=59895 RepID=A0A103STZ1_CYNCS|nr:cold-regulated 413 inner membrane protein 2, chloroplastic-like [Cynara cardunculus var. scolymus]KVG94995.1 Cold acclimation protein WCOR413 [Cynara cardunculus var. scolymus]